MGLDLILYRKNKKLQEMSLEEELDSELAYGRKTWAIAGFFTRRCKVLQDDWLFEVTKADWDSFMKAIDKLNDPNFREKVEFFVFLKDGSTHMEVYKELEKWLNHALDNDNPYQLGLEWELAALLRWFDADSEVQQAFKDGAPVELVQSY